MNEHIAFGRLHAHPDIPGREPGRAPDLTAGGLHYPGDEAPWYLPVGDEIRIFEQCHARGLAVMLKGPTGCGKTRFVEHMAWRLGRPLVTVACHDDLTASGIAPKQACLAGIIAPLSDDAALVAAMRDLAHALFV